MVMPQLNHVVGCARNSFRYMARMVMHIHDPMTNSTQMVSCQKALGLTSTANVIVGNHLCLAFDAAKSSISSLSTRSLSGLKFEWARWPQKSITLLSLNLP